MAEAEWARQFTDLATLYGWTYAHFRPARTNKGWRTPVEGPGGAGWPDYVLWRERVIFVELKSERGRLSHEQLDVMGLGDARGGLLGAGAEVYVWWPSDFRSAHEVLRRRA